MITTKQSWVDKIQFNEEELKIGIKFKTKYCPICKIHHKTDFLWYQFDKENYKRFKEGVIGIERPAA
ncbi:hypothetical protein LCGC14_1960210 [marine sediment metagenome]|uniref:Uncharacterized protein n=1 Tax=marine sediment metagenome TaxID=412755 RepID=A0A0F9HT64_9ZZZZ